MHPHLEVAASRLPACLLLLALVACSTGKQPEIKHAANEQPRVEFQQDATGFTIVEDVQVGADVRASYEGAVRMLEKTEYEPGIASLVKVSESAPNVTAVHIDLGIAYARSADLDRAEASFKKALQLNPRHPI